jgi:SAM-dependent methyltransferase
VTKRTEAFCAFLSSQLTAPLRLLEVGCGRGELALALADRGFDVTAIDPHAPDGSLFQRVGLEDFSDARGFDAVIASVSLHHIDDLPGALDKIASFLPPGGVLALEEWAKERLTGATARWYYHQRRALAAVGREDTIAEDFDTWQRQTEADLADLHPLSEIRKELASRFSERFSESRPYLYSRRLDDAVEPLERRLIDEGAIEATGLWYVGERL